MGKYNYKKKCKNDALVLTQEKRQEFLDKLHEGMTVGEAKKVCGITFNQAMGTIDLNLNKILYLKLNKVSV